jgi:hypothetical protein
VLPQHRNDPLFREPRLLHLRLPQGDGFYPLLEEVQGLRSQSCDPDDENVQSRCLRHHPGTLAATSNYALSYIGANLRVTARCL